MSDGAQDIIKLIAEHASVDPASVNRDSKLADLEIESLDVVEIVFKLEEHFDIEIPYNANEDAQGEAEFETIGDVIDAVMPLVDKK